MDSIQSVSKWLQGLKTLPIPCFVTWSNSVNTICCTFPAHLSLDFSVNPDHIKHRPKRSGSFLLIFNRSFKAAAVDEGPPCATNKWSWRLLRCDSTVDTPSTYFGSRGRDPCLEPSQPGPLLLRCQG